MAITDLARDEITGKNKSFNRMGVLMNCTPKEFVEAISQHRFWDCEADLRNPNHNPKNLKTIKDG